MYLIGGGEVYLYKELIIYWIMILKLKICHQNSIKVKLRVSLNGEIHGKKSNLRLTKPMKLENQ